MRGATVRVWTSPSDPAVRGFEALIEPLAPQDVAKSLRDLDLTRCTNASFLLLPLAQTDQYGVERAIESALGASETLRICLTIDEKTLERVDSRQLNGDRVGLVLDRLSLTTSTGAIVHDVLEAVRFDPSFIADSLCSVRIDAALRAMLSLARSLGLATLGSAAAGQRSAKIFEYPFDYVSELESAKPATLIPTPVQRGKKTLGRSMRAG
jgi:hypothetical protein